MITTWIQGNRLYIVALIVALIGTPVLLGLSIHDQGATVPLARLADHWGESVSCQGTLVGYNTSGAPVEAYLFDDGVTVKVVAEYWPTNAPRLYEIVQVKGSVLGSSLDPIVYCSEAGGIRSLGWDRPTEVILSEISNSTAGIYRTECIVFDVWSGWDDGTIWVRDLEGLEEPLEVECPAGVNQLIPGDLVELGLVSNGTDLHCYHTDHTVVVGHVEPTVLDIPLIVSRYWNAPELVLDQYLGLVGYVKYEPYSEGPCTIALCEKLVDPRYSISAKVDSGFGLHMGDLIELKGRLEPRDGRLDMAFESENTRIVTSHGPWRMDLEELVEDPGPFDGVQVSVLGSYVDSDPPLLTECNRSLILVSSPPCENNTLVRVHGTFELVKGWQQSLSYGINVSRIEKV